jgi:hypothetical protein
MMDDAVDGFDMKVVGAVGVDDAVMVLGQWLDDRPIPLAEVRRSAVQLLDGWREVMASLAAAIEATGSLDQVAATMAAKRGHAAMPRAVRMSQEDRARAHGYLIALVTGQDAELEQREPDRVLLERMLGLRSWHAGGIAGAAGLGLDARDLELVRPEEHAALQVKASSDDELEYACSLTQLLIDWLPVLAPMLLAEFGAKGRVFEDLIQGALADPPPAVLALLVVGVLRGLVASEQAPAELRRRRDALAAGTVDIELLELVPRAERQRAFEGLPARRQRRIRAAVVMRKRSARSIDVAAD